MARTIEAIELWHLIWILIEVRKAYRDRLAEPKCQQEIDLIHQIDSFFESMI